MLDTLALLSAALLLGGMTFFSFGFAPVLFAQLPMDKVRPLLRGTFPYYYLVVIGMGVVCTGLTAFLSPLAGALMAAITLSTVYARQVLMHQINAATDAGNKKKFGMLHGASVVLQLIQIGLAGWALVLVAGA